MMDLREEILDHYRHPRNFGKLTGATHRAERLNVSCGDKVSFELKVDGEGVVREVAWEGEGCSMSMASASMLSEEILGKKLEEVRQWEEGKMFEMVGEVNPGRVKCVLLPLIALKGVGGV